MGKWFEFVDDEDFIFFGFGTEVEAYIYNTRFNQSSDYLNEVTNKSILNQLNMGHGSGFNLKQELLALGVGEDYINIQELNHLFYNVESVI